MNIPTDKKLHLLAGWLIASLFDDDLIIALLASIIVGALKELIYDDLLDKGTPDFYDFLATAIGGVLFVIFKILKTGIQQNGFYYYFNLIF
jgi:hypothetical protein